MIRYEHLLGREFDFERANCYSLARDFYRDNFGIELSDYPCPTNWWNHDLDLYRDLAETEGFLLQNIHSRDLRAGDLLISAIKSSVGNHIGIYLDGNRVLHHLVGQRSCTTAFGGIFRNNLVAVYRHPLVPIDAGEKVTDVRSVLPPHVLRKLEDLKARQGTQEAPQD